MVKGKGPCPPSRPGDSPRSAARCARARSIFPGWLLRHYLEDGEDNEIGLRVRDYRARRSVPREPLGRICGGVREVDRVRAAEKLLGRGTVGRCEGCTSFQFRGFLRRWRFALAAGNVATSSVLERHSPKRWRSRCRPRGKHSELANCFDGIDTGTFAVFGSASKDGE